MQSRQPPTPQALPPSSQSNMLQVRNEYKLLLEEFTRQEQSISNIADLYRKFKLLKCYQTEYEKNHELKKELSFWDQFRTTKEVFLENEINKLNGILGEAQEKMRLFKIQQQKDLEKIETLKKLTQ